MLEQAEALNMILQSKHVLEIARDTRAKSRLRAEKLCTRIEITLNAIKRYQERTEEIEASHRS